MADTKVFSFPENGNSTSNIPFSIPIGGNGFGFGNGMSVMVIGGATSKQQWWDTLSHEVDHLQDAVMEYYDVDAGTEDAAWLQGYIMRLIVKAMMGDGTM